MKKNCYLFTKISVYFSVMFLLSLSLPCIYGQNLDLIREPRNYYESPIFKDSVGRLYSSLITVKFKDEIFNNIQRVNDFDVSNTDFKSDEHKKIFEQLNNIFGPFHFRFKYSDYKYGSNF